MESQKPRHFKISNLEIKTHRHLETQNLRNKEYQKLNLKRLRKRERDLRERETGEESVTRKFGCMEGKRLRYLGTQKLLTNILLLFNLDNQTFITLKSVGIWRFTNI